MGGAVFHLTGPALDRAAIGVIRSVDGVRGVRRVDEDTLEVTVEDGGEMLTELIETLRLASIEVDELEEQHPSFDDVFIKLMTDRGAVRS